MKSVLFFIGYMGSGKSHAILKMAEMNRFETVDLDRAIEQHKGMTIEEIFDQEGEASFRAMEMRLLKHLVVSEGIRVIGCGGGTPCIAGALDWMKSKGYVVHLSPPFEVIEERLFASTNAPHRPLLMNANGVMKSAEEVKRHWVSRNACYADADERLVKELGKEDFERWELLLSESGSD
jgi:shikimate kinase